MFWGFFSFFRIDASLVRKQYNVYIVAVPMTVWQMVLDVGCPGDVKINSMNLRNKSMKYINLNKDLLNL